MIQLGLDAPLPAVLDERKAISTLHRIKSIVIGSSGNLVEWYDWYVYSAFALYFGKWFFPSGNPTTELLKAAGVFAFGFFMRPVGGWLFGLYADRRGRRSALVLSVALMCLGSLIITFAPTYQSVGALAPGILIGARLLQGLSVGGEYGASATYLCEMATSDRRGFYSSFQYVTLIMGQLLALAVLIVLQRLLLTPQQLETWGWRVPFAIGALCAITAFYLRRQIDETESFSAHVKDQPKENLLAVLLRYRREMLIVVGMTFGGTTAFYTYTTYMQQYLVNTVGLAKDAATLISAASLLIFLLVQPIVGALSDRVGRRPLLIAFGVLGTVLTVPLLTAIAGTKSPWAAFFLITAALVILSNYTAVNAVVKAELFPASVRALGVGLPYAVTVSIFGGTSEYVALWLKGAGHESLFYWLVAASIAVSLWVYVSTPDTKAKSRIDEDLRVRA
jgi:MHS family alpha-ketoglutarate permease-like MFS transporter